MFYLKKCTRSLNIRETIVKLFTRWQWNRLESIPSSLQYNPYALEVVSLLADFSVCFCSHVVPVWRKLTAFASTISGVQFSLTPTHCFFSPILEAATLQMRLIHIICVAIYLVVASHRRTPSVPLSQVSLRVDSIGGVDKLFHTLYHTMPYYDRK